MQLEATGAATVRLLHHGLERSGGVHPAERDDAPRVRGCGVAHPEVGLAEVARCAGLIRRKRRRGGDAVGVEVADKVIRTQRMPIAVDAEVHVHVHDAGAIGNHHAAPRPLLDARQRVHIRPGRAEHRCVLAEKAPAQCVRASKSSIMRRKPSGIGVASPPSHDSTPTITARASATCSAPSASMRSRRASIE